MKDLLIKAALIIVRLCHYWVCTSWVGSLANLAAYTLYLSGFNLWQGTMKMQIKTTTFVNACILKREMNVSCIELMLWSTSWTNSRGTLKSPVFQAYGQLWMAVMVRAMNIKLTLSINDLSFIPMCRMR
jgi:hypothetical protein